MAVRRYTELVAWQRAMDLVESVYRLTQGFPTAELYGLISQMRRCAVSIAANIAEGQGRGAGGEFAHHLRIANGSRQELETHVMIAVRLGFTREDAAAPILELAAETGRLISGLHRSVCS